MLVFFMPKGGDTLANIHVPLGVNKGNPRTAQQFRSRSYIEIHTPSASYGPGQQYDPSKSLLQWTFNKTLSSQSASNNVGTASIVLTAGINAEAGPTKMWTDFVSVQDLIVIRVSANGDNTMRTRFIGIISNIQYNDDTQSSPENPTRNITIQAQDLMVGLESQIVFPVEKLKFVNSDNKHLVQLITDLEVIGSNTGGAMNSGYLFPLLSSLFSQSTSAGNLILSPSQLAQTIMDKMAKALYSPSFYIRNASTGSRVTWYNLVTQAFEHTHQFSGVNFYVTPQQETLSQMLASVMNPPFLEFFGDVRSADEMSDIPSPYYGRKATTSFGNDNAEFQMVIRNTPFNTSSSALGTSPDAFDQLPIVDAYLKTVSQRGIYRTTSDTVNYYLAYPQTYMQNPGVQAAILSMYGAMVDVKSVTKYGLQPMEVPVLGFLGFSAFGNPASSDIVATIEAFEQTLYDWYHLNPDYVRGSVTVHGNPILRVGKRVRFPQLGLTGYIEGIQETFINMTSYQTQVTFSRGLYDDWSTSGWRAPD